MQHGRRVVNGPGALDLEISKVRQYGALSRAGVAIPRTIAVAGKGRLVQAAREAFGKGRFILKPNRGRSEEHTSELQSLMRISYAVFCLKKKKENEHRQEYVKSINY